MGLQRLTACSRPCLSLQPPQMCRGHPTPLHSPLGWPLRCTFVLAPAHGLSPRPGAGGGPACSGTAWPWGSHPRNGERPLLQPQSGFVCVPWQVLRSSLDAYRLGFTARDTRGVGGPHVRAEAPEAQRGEVHVQGR